MLHIYSSRVYLNYTIKDLKYIPICLMNLSNNVHEFDPLKCTTVRNALAAVVLTRPFLGTDSNNNTQAPPS